MQQLSPVAVALPAQLAPPEEEAWGLPASLWCPRRMGIFDYTLICVSHLTLPEDLRQLRLMGGLSVSHVASGCLGG